MGKSRNTGGDVLSCLIFFQESLTPGPFGNLALGALALWCMFGVVKEVLVLMGKGQGREHSTAPIKIELVSDPTVEYRLNKLDEEMKERITRTEHETQQKFVREQLTRIETIVQRMWTSRSIFTGKHPDLEG